VCKVFGVCMYVMYLSACMLVLGVDLSMCATVE
jgi:hypothetical protein